jgi:predicted xylose isomerase-like sugar epimerase
LRWKAKHEKFHHAVTVEEWRLPDGTDLVEVSIRVQPEEYVEAKKQFEAHLSKIGLDPKGAQQTKALTALQYFTDQLRKQKKK